MLGMCHDYAGAPSALWKSQEQVPPPPQGSCQQQAKVLPSVATNPDMTGTSTSGTRACKNGALDVRDIYSA